MSRRSARGFTLLELLITAGIGMMIMAVAYQVYRSTEADTKVREAAMLVGFINQSADQIAAASPSFQVPTAAAPANITTANLITGFASESNTLPFGSETIGNQIYGPFGLITTSVMSSAGTANDLFAIDMPNVPSKSCAQLLQRAMSFSPIYDMYVDGALVALSPAPVKDGSGNVVAPGRSGIRPDLVTTLCVKAPYVTIRFRKLKDIHFADLRRQQLGNTLSGAESALITPLYARQTAAMAARETAQAAF